MPSEQLRERALKGAGDLFYAEGINATGVARIAEGLGMSKRTLYELFGSKDALVTEALAVRDEPMRRAFIDQAEAGTNDPAEQLVAVFAAVDRLREHPGFNGCPFLRASTEIADPDHPARHVVVEHKEALRRWMERRAKSAGLRRPRRLSHQLMIVFDGVLAHTAATPGVPAVGVEVAQVLVDAARPATDR